MNASTRIRAISPALRGAGMESTRICLQLALVVVDGVGWRWLAVNALVGVGDLTSESRGFSWLTASRLKLLKWVLLPIASVTRRTL